MSTTAIFLVGLFASNLCLAFGVLTAMGLRAAAAEAKLDQDLTDLKARDAGPDAELFADEGTVVPMGAKGQARR